MANTFSKPVKQKVLAYQGLSQAIDYCTIFFWYNAETELFR